MISLQTTAVFVVQGDDGCSFEEIDATHTNIQTLSGQRTELLVLNLAVNIVATRL